MDARGSRDDGVAEAALARLPGGFGTPSARDQQRGSILGPLGKFWTSRACSELSWAKPSPFRVSGQVAVRQANPVLHPGRSLVCGRAGDAGM